jgi:biotin transporter BioY
METFAQPVALTGGATQVVATGRGYLAGYTIRETAAGAATFRLWDNASAASGTILATISLAASAAVDVVYPMDIAFTNGVFLERVSGSTYEGSVRIG